MVSTDPIGDMLTRVRNALAVSKDEVRLPHSNIKEAVAKILADSKYIVSVASEKEGVEKTLVLTLSGERKYSPITEIKRVSTPGRRVYAKSNEIPVVKQGRGIVIVSTSKGVMTGAQARDQKLGGEVICSVY